MRVTVDGLTIRREADLHVLLARELDFGPYYGHNLNALWDRLSTDVERPVELVWQHSEASRAQLGAESFERIAALLERVVRQDGQAAAGGLGGDDVEVGPDLVGAGRGDRGEFVGEGGGGARRGRVEEVGQVAGGRDHRGEPAAVEPGSGESPVDLVGPAAVQGGDGGVGEGAQAGDHLLHGGDGETRLGDVVRGEGQLGPHAGHPLRPPGTAALPEDSAPA
ncbi:barstar family protein [Kitasatospora sp. NPDC093558]|uniref:barstar family protein n=1 Tax=Kitasatospora sp. NPDC093558 TaxID=3155201 RepID=UPI00341FCFF9